jgi:hypothetical protein
VVANAHVPSFVAFVAFLCATNGLLATEVAAQTMTLISADANGTPANAESWRPSISGDGRYVAFESTATSLAVFDKDVRRTVGITGDAYVTSQMGAVLTGDPRDVALRTALYAALQKS